MANSMRELLDRARDFHHQLSELYSQSLAIASDERAKILLDYMSAHETTLEQAIEDYKQEAASKQVLDHWVQFPPDTATCKCFDNVEALDSSMTVNDIISVVMQLDDCLIRFYRQLAEEAHNEIISNIFKRLLMLEESEERIAVRNALELEQI